MVTSIKQKPVVRRIGRLVVSVHDWGIEIKGYRKRKAKRITWEQVASLADDSEPILLQEETNRGRRVLGQLGARE